MRVVDTVVSAGWLLFMVFAGVGLVALPLDLLMAFMGRPKATITHSEFIKRAKGLGIRAKAIKVEVIMPHIPVWCWTRYIQQRFSVSPAQVTVSPRFATSHKMFPLFIALECIKSTGNVGGVRAGCGGCAEEGREGGGARAQVAWGLSTHPAAAARARTRLQGPRARLPPGAPPETDTHLLSTNVLPFAKFCWECADHAGLLLHTPGRRSSSLCKGGAAPASSQNVTLLAIAKIPVSMIWSWVLPSCSSPMCKPNCSTDADF